jgi:cell division protein FtsB
MSARAGGLAIVVVLLLTLAIGPVRLLLAERGQLADLRRQTEELQRENADLQTKVQRFNDPDYLERLARECLGMVRPGEIAFVTVPKHGAPITPAC